MSRGEAVGNVSGPARLLLVLQSSALGGMENHCIQLATEMVRRRTAVLATVPEAPTFDPLDAALRRAGADVERIDTDARRGRAAQVIGVARLIRCVRRFRPSVVHLHSGGATGGLAVALVGRLAASGVVVITEHDVPSARPGLKQRINRYLMDRTLHVIVAVSRHNASIRLKRLGAPTEKLAVVINGTSLPKVPAPVQAANRARVRSSLGLPADATVVGSVVRLAPGKGLATLLKAFALLQGQVDARLLLVGTGPLEEKLRAMASNLKIQDRLVMTGHQSDPGPFVDAMDIFVLPVPMGSGSIALLEAMGRARPPVITFGNGEEPVVPERTGLWSPPEDPDALAAALLRLSLDRTLRERLGRAAAGHVHRHYSIERVVDDLIDVYAEARGGSVPRGLRATDPSDRNPGARQPQLQSAAGGQA